MRLIIQDFKDPTLLHRGFGFRIEMKIQSASIHYIDGLVDIVHHIVMCVAAIGFTKAAEAGQYWNSSGCLFQLDGVYNVSNSLFISSLGLRRSKLNFRR